MKQQAISKEQFMETLQAFAKRNSIPLEVSNWGDLSIKGFTSGTWADEASVSVRIFHDTKVLTDRKIQVIKFGEVQLNWSSAHRSVAQAMVALENYKEALRVAALLQAFLENCLPVEDVVKDEVKA